MTSFKKLIGRIGLLAFCYVFSGVAIAIFLVHLPIRIMRYLFSTRVTTPRPKVEVIVHEPTESASNPRDTLLFIHGFPDGPALFDANVAHFTKEGYRCLVVALPGSRGEAVRVALHPEEIIDMIYRAVTEVHNGSVTAIGHDWGSFYVRILTKKYPSLVKRLVALDVGRFRKHALSAWVSIIAYQLMLVLFFILGDPAGTICTRIFLWYASYKVRPLNELTADMCSPYLGLQRAIAEQALWGRPMAPKPVGDTKGGPIPLLFLYGKIKNFHFHDDKFLEHVRKMPCGEVVGLPCGHWVSVEQENECNTLIGRWLEKSKDSVRQDQS